MRGEAPVRIRHIAAVRAGLEQPILCGGRAVGIIDFEAIPLRTEHPLGGQKFLYRAVSELGLREIIDLRAGKIVLRCVSKLHQNIGDMIAHGNQRFRRQLRAKRGAGRGLGDRLRIGVLQLRRSGYRGRGRSSRKTDHHR